VGRAISIPYGAIKSVSEGFKEVVKAIFQFLMVRLKEFRLICF